LQKKRVAKIEEAVPFALMDLENVGVTQINLPSIMEQDVEAKVIGWIAAHFLKTLVEKKLYKYSTERGNIKSVFEIATIDDLAFLILLVEDSYNIWKGMAEDIAMDRPDEEGDLNEPARKKLKRINYKEKKKHGKEGKHGKSGTGLSSPEAQMRYQVLRRRMQEVKKDQCLKDKVDAVFKKEIDDCREDEDNVGSGKSSFAREQQLLNQEPEANKEVMEDLLEEMGLDQSTFVML
jgi:hypothetical protein